MALHLYRRHGFHCLGGRCVCVATPNPGRFSDASHPQSASRPRWHPDSAQRRAARLEKGSADAQRETAQADLRLLARSAYWEAVRTAASLEVELRPGARVFRIDGREVPPREYHGRLEVVVYSTDRLRVVRGSMRDRRQFLDRQAAALWPSYRAETRGFERLLAQRNAALESRAADLDAWTERFVESGARLRRRRTRPRSTAWRSNRPYSKPHVSSNG